MQRCLSRPWSADSVCGSRCRRTCYHSGPRRATTHLYVIPRTDPPLAMQQLGQALSLERVVDELDIDSLATLGFHGPDDIRGLVASEAVRSAALVTVPIGSTLAVSLDDGGGQLSVLAPPGMPPNVKKAIEVVAGLIRETPDHQLLILAILLLWARKYGSLAWREYCEALLPPPRELSCLMCYTPEELATLQLPHLVDEASRQHDWARWAHSHWLSSSSGALRRLGLADGLEDTVWALAVVRSRAVEFQIGLTAGSGSGSRASSDYGPGALRLGKARQRSPGPIVSVLAPVVDLANHCNDPNCVIQLTTDRSRIVLLPRRPISPKEPLTVDYGFDRSSLELMADYGFVTPANPYDGEVDLPGADKLPPLEHSCLEAAARALVRRRRRGLEQQASMAVRKDMPVATATVDRSVGRASDGGDCDVGSVDMAVQDNDQEELEEGESVVREEVREEEEVFVPVHDGNGAEAEAVFKDRLRAAVALLAPRMNPLSGASGGNFSTPATQRIVAGLWHKLVRHYADNLATSLEQDRSLLEEIVAGRVSGFTAGPSLSLDPDAMPPSQPATPLPPLSPSTGGSLQSTAWGRRPMQPQRAEGGQAVGKRVVQGEGTKEKTEATGAAPPPSSTNGSGGDGNRAKAAGLTGSVVSACRTGRRAGRLYAAVRARIEHKELLTVAEELLIQYARH